MEKKETMSEIRRRNEKKGIVMNNMKIIGGTLAADQYADSFLQHLPSDKSDDYTHTGNSWSQDSLDYAYHKYDPGVYSNPYGDGKKKPGETETERRSETETAQVTESMIENEMDKVAG